MANPDLPVGALAKQPKGSRWMELRDKRKGLVKAEDAAKAEVRKRDRICRWPHCQNCRRYKPAFEVAHVVRAKGMGGDHGTVSTPDKMMLLDRITHGEQERNTRDVRPLTDAGTDGPCEFWSWTAQDGWFLIARETAPFRYDRD
jgi:hypothetical protein